MLVSLALIKTATGVNLLEVRESELHTRRIKVDVETLFNADTKTLTTPEGTLTYQRSEIVNGFSGTGYVLLVHFNFIPSKESVKGATVLDQNFSFKRGEEKLGHGLMSKESPQELIDDQNRSVLPGKAGENQVLVAVYELGQDNTSPITVEVAGHTFLAVN